MSLGGQLVVGGVIFILVTVVMLIWAVSYSASQRNKFTSARWAGLIKEAEKHKVYLPINPVSTPGIAVLWGFVAMAVALFSGGYGGYFQWKAVREADLLARLGVTAQAQVISHRVQQGSKGSKSYYVKYTFFPRSGEISSGEVTKEESVSSDYYASVNPGDEIQIIYVPEEPGVSQIMALYHKGSFTVWPGIIGGVIALIALMLAWGQQMEYGRAMRLEQEGIEGQSTVKDLYFETGSKGARTYYVAYELPNRMVIRHSVNEGLYKRLRLGDPIPLRYVPDEPAIFRPQW